MKPLTNPRRHLKKGEVFFSTRRLRRDGVGDGWPININIYMSTSSNPNGEEFEIVRIVKAGMVARRAVKGANET